jgi:hypothetical protein
MKQLERADYAKTGNFNRAPRSLKCDSRIASRKNGGNDP